MGWCSSCFVCGPCETGPSSEEGIFWPRDDNHTHAPQLTCGGGEPRYPPGQALRRPSERQPRYTHPRVPSIQAEPPCRLCPFFSKRQGLESLPFYILVTIHAAQGLCWPSCPWPHTSRCVIAVAVLPLGGGGGGECQSRQLLRPLSCRQSSVPRHKCTSTDERDSSAWGLGVIRTQGHGWHLTQALAIGRGSTHYFCCAQLL